MNANRHPYSLRNFLRAQLKEPGTTKGGRTRIQIFILKTPYLKAYRPVKAACELTEVFSLLWYRAIFGEDPKPKAMQEAKALV
jgi:hypothetical protein